MKEKTILFQYNIDSYGNPTSTKIKEVAQVSPLKYTIQLEQIPDEQFGVTLLNKDNTSMVQVFNYDDVEKTENSYYVNYTNGLIYFNSNQGTEKKIINYYGTGIELISCKRVFDGHYDANGKWIVEILQDIIDAGREAIELMKNVGDIATILQLLETKVAEGDTKIQELQDKIDEANDLTKVTGNEEVIINTSDWVSDGNGGYYAVVNHSCNSENIHVTFKRTTTKENMTLGYTIINNSSFKVFNHENVTTSCIISAMYYRATQTISDDIAQEVVQARGGESSLGERLDNIDSQLDNIDSQLDNNVRELPQVKKSVKLQHILLGMDSLTNGAGNTSYVDYFRDKIHGVLGYGGAGYLPFEYQTLVNDSEYFSMNFVDDGTWVYLSGLTDLNNLSVINSFDNKGLYTENANGTTVRIECKTNCKYIKLIYLQQENGGSFTVQYNNGGNLQSVNTLGQTMVKTILLEKNDNIKQGIFTITGTGKLTLYGMYCYNDEGAIVSKFGQGGQLLTKIIKNKEITDMWINILNPTFALLDCGTNDGGSDIFQNKYEILVQSLKDINCDITLIRPHNMAIEWTCEQYLFNVSKNKDIPILNIKNLFGNSFEEASNNGCMLDGIHPNDKGNIIKANKYLDYLSIPKISTLINKSYVSNSDTENLYENVVKLTDKIVYTHSSETEGIELYNLGMIWSNGVKIPCAIIEIIANTTINYTSLKSKKVTFIMYNDSDTNKSKFEQSSINNQILIDNDSYDFEFIIENLNNRTLIKLKTNSPYWINANITAKAYIVNNVNTTDIHVIEN